MDPAVVGWVEQEDMGAVGDSIEVRGLEVTVRDFGTGEQQKRNCTSSAGHKKYLGSKRTT